MHFHGTLLIKKHPLCQIDFFSMSYTRIFLLLILELWIAMNSDEEVLKW